MNQGASPGRRVVITGVGIVSPIGIGREAFWANLSAGKSGVGPIREQFQGCAAIPGLVGAEIADFDEKTARDLVPKSQRKSLRVMCREIQMGSASAMLAVADAGLDLESVDHDRFGVDFGANLMFSPPVQLKDACWSCLDEQGRFQFDEWGRSGMGNLEPLWLLKYLPNMPACHIAIFLDAHGPSNSVTLDEASGNLALTEAMHVIRRGAADVMIAGTTGTRIHQVKTVHAALWDELGSDPDDPAASCRPFDVRRTGQVVGEGACSLILEAESHARARGANILGTVLGGSSSCVWDRDGEPDVRQALANAAGRALRAAGLSPSDIGHINAHGLATRAADLLEARAIHDVFGESGAAVPVTALKGYLGNSAASCGTLELAGSLLGLAHGVIPQTINCQQPDPECNLNVVHGAAQPAKSKTLLKLSFTRAAQATAIVVDCSG